MQISARNQLRGIVKGVELGAIMAEVVVSIGDQEIVAAITRGSTERLGLKEGDEVHRDHQGHRGDDRDRRVIPPS